MKNDLHEDLGNTYTDSFSRSPTIIARPTNTVHLALRWRVTLTGGLEVEAPTILSTAHGYCQVHINSFRISGQISSDQASYVRRGLFVC